MHNIIHIELFQISQTIICKYVETYKITINDGNDNYVNQSEGPDLVILDKINCLYDFMVIYILTT